MKRIRFSLFTLLAAAGLSLAAPQAHARPHVDVSTSIGFELPSGAVYLSVRDQPYYHHRNTYYRHTRHGYVVTRAPIGAFIHELPRSYVRINYRGTPYYRCEDVFYRPSRGGYVVVDAPAYVRYAQPERVVENRAATEQAEPADPYASYRTVWIGERELYLKDGQFFKKTPDGLAWTEAPLGRVTSKLPEGAISVWYQEEEYFEAAGIYFRKIPSGYKVVTGPWNAEETTSTEEPTS